MSQRVLFILKRREDFNSEVHNQIGLSTGLYNSASFMSDMLNDAGIESKVVVVVDNNGIDREVTQYKPTHVIIEALWVVPTKFTVLQSLHPAVTWIVRLHSEIPFIAGEGMAMDWIGDYGSFSRVLIGVNAPRMMKDVKFFLKHKGLDDYDVNHKTIYLPNFYPQEYKSHKEEFENKKTVIDVGCFGAVRLLKNHLIQAIAAIEFAERLGKKLRFHINAGRIEMKGDAVAKNLRTLFEQIYKSGHQLISHDWRPREQFLELCKEMDVGLQVSFSETFNIVAADLISQGVPVVGSSEIPWLSNTSCASPTNSEDIAEKLLSAYGSPKKNVNTNQRNLTKYTNETRKQWLNYFSGVNGNGT